MKRFAEDRGLPWREDTAGNVVVERGGANGGEAAETLVIQGTHNTRLWVKKKATTRQFRPFYDDPIRFLHTNLNTKLDTSPSRLNLNPFETLSVFYILISI